MTDRPLILVTNDDGIDSVGLHVLARAMRDLGEVMIVAPDAECSGSSAAVGSLWDNTPDVHQSSVEGIDTTWTVSGPPALCVLYAHLGAFRRKPDLIVSGINPGVNVGKAVYHSGTVGAALTGRNGGVSGVAVSQSVSFKDVERLGWDGVIGAIHWDTAASMARAAVEAMLADSDDEPRVLNINVPDLPLSQIAGWKWTEVGLSPPRTMTTVRLNPKIGHEGSFEVVFDVGDVSQHAEGTDSAAIIANAASFTWLSPITALDSPTEHIDDQLGNILS